MELKELCAKIAAIGGEVNIQYHADSQIFEIKLTTPKFTEHAKLTLAMLEQANFDVSSTLIDHLIIDALRKKDGAKIFGTNYELECPSCGRVDYSSSKFCSRCGQQKREY